MTPDQRRQALVLLGWRFVQTLALVLAAGFVVWLFLLVATFVFE